MGYVLSRAVVRAAAFTAGFGILVAATPGAASTAVYPVNQCVSAKMKSAAHECGAVLKAWSVWEKTQDNAKRDAKIAAAQTALNTAWGAAETASSTAGVDCADTTLSASALGLLVGSAAAQIVTDVNAGLDLSQKADSKCGGNLLKLAAKKCAALLNTESKFVFQPAKDVGGLKRNAAEVKIGHAFSLGWNKVFAKGCASTAEEGTVEGDVDTLSQSVVTNTTVSPNVDNTQFMTITPATPVSYQGRTFNPICAEGGSYEFFAKRGSTNHLLVYYEGGGACWEQLTCSVPVCDISADSSDNPNGYPVGFFDLSNPDNPFKDWNIVFVSYCSCDIHFGDTSQDYSNVNPMAPVHIEHRGYENSRVVEKWAREHFVNPDVVFVTGSSAGAYGAWFNAPLHEGVWPASKFHVLADAGNGVITQSFLQNFFPNWNFAANLPANIPGLQETLNNGTGIPGYTKVVANFFPDTTWAHYCTAFDGGFGGQTGFYNLMLNNNNPVTALTWWNGSCAFNSVMTAQDVSTAADLPANYRYYIGTGSRHTMWGSNKVYTDTTGGVPTLVDWINATLDSSPPTANDPAWSNVECTNCGLLLPGDPQPSPLQPPFQQVGSDVVVTCP